MLIYLQALPFFREFRSSDKMFNVKNKFYAPANLITFSYSMEPEQVRIFHSS